MKIFETKTQFIKEDDGIKVPEGVKTYSIIFTSNMNSSYLMEFPQYELFFKATGGWGYKSFLWLNYRGLVIYPKSNENRETFILNLLNILKEGKYKTKMEDFFKDRLSKKNYSKYESVLNTDNPKIKQLESELETLKRTVEELKSNQKDDYFMQIEEENKMLHSKLIKLKELLDE